MRQLGCLREGGPSERATPLQNRLVGIKPIGINRFSTPMSESDSGRVHGMTVILGDRGCIRGLVEGLLSRSASANTRNRRRFHAPMNATMPRRVILHRRGLLNRNR